uniref:ACB domain-containing protein n=1 Tax=Periophthalmus magnuspinnatus TaxID=409849 RepID=A0A3B3ZB54_9GOBI
MTVSWVCAGASVEQFEEAKSKLSTLKNDPGNEAKLKIYALFKQSTVGCCSTARPGMLDFINRAKWDAWNALGDISQVSSKDMTSSPVFFPNFLNA